MSIILPECTLSLPRLRLNGVKHFSRDARMHLDSATAPSVANPYYAAALAQLQGAEQRGAKPDDDGEKGAKKAAEPDCTGSVQKNATPLDSEDRLKRLEECFQKCLDELKTLRSQQDQGKQGARVNSPLEPPIPDKDTALDTRTLHPLPPTDENALELAVSKATYEARVESQSSLRPLPPRRLPLP